MVPQRGAELEHELDYGLKVCVRQSISTQMRDITSGSTSPHNVPAQAGIAMRVHTLPFESLDYDEIAYCLNSIQTNLWTLSISCIRPITASSKAPVPPDSDLSSRYSCLESKKESINPGGTLWVRSNGRQYSSLGMSSGDVLKSLRDSHTLHHERRRLSL